MPSGANSNDLGLDFDMMSLVFALDFSKIIIIFALDFIKEYLWERVL